MAIRNRVLPNSQINNSKSQYLYINQEQRLTYKEMKQLKTITIGILFLLSQSIKAQISVNVNIGSPPPWGPVGYTTERYYYLPDVEAYYDIQTSMFIYSGNGGWIHNSYLPGVYRNYDLYNGYKVVITNYRGNTPYIYYKNHKQKYAKGYRSRPQKTIGQKPGKGNSSPQKNLHNKPNKQMNQGNKKQQSGGGSHGGGNGKGKKK